MLYNYTMSDLNQNFSKLYRQFNQLMYSQNLDDKRRLIKKLESDSLSADFWSNEVNAKNTLKQLSHLKDTLDQFESLQQKFTDIKDLIELTSDQTSREINQELQTEFETLEKSYKRLKLNSLLSEKFDSHDAILSIHAGQGGTEAMDWAMMLKRMYQRYFESKNWKYQLLEEVPGEEAGIKSATFQIEAPFAYGYLKSESGTHRLVRLSPFNSDNLRQTSFAGVEVLPLIQNQSGIEIRPEDLDWQFYRSGGKGGQNVNKVNTAVRLTHTPSGIVVTSSSQRHQEQNRKIAMEVLEAKLWQLQEIQQGKKLQSIKGAHKIPGWGNQIRSYVLHPYQMVKDLRTEYETTQTQAVLDGDLDGFIESYLLS